LSPSSLPSKVGSLLLTRAEAWTTASSLFVAACGAQWYVSRATFDLKSFGDRTIGIAVLQGVDAADRTNTYILAIALFAALFLLLNLLHNLFGHWLRGGTSEGAQERYQELIFDLSALGLFTVWWSLWQPGSGVVASSRLLLVATVVIDGLLGLKRWAVTSRILVLAEKHAVAIVVGGLLPASGFAMYGAVFHRVPSLSAAGLLAYVGLAFLALAGYGWFVWRGRVRSGESLPVQQTLLAASVPLLLIPASLPISNELQYTLSRHVRSGAAVAAVIWLVLLLVAAGIYLRGARPSRGGERTPFLFRNVILPIVVGTIGLYLAYLPRLEVNGFNIFHFGENLIPAQQMFQFGSIPFVDFYPTHGFSRIYPQILYSLVNGYSLVAPTLWEWIAAVAGWILYYFLFKALLGARRAFLVTIFLPVHYVFTEDYISLVIPVLLGAWTFSSGNTWTGWRRYFPLWLAGGLMMGWRIDFGIAYLVAVLAIFTLLQARDAAAGRARAHEVVWFGLTGAGVLLAMLAGLAGLCLYHGQAIRGVLAEIGRFATYQGPVQAYEQIFDRFSALVVIQYVLVPAVLMACLLAFVRSLDRDETVPRARIILALLAVFLLIMTVRATQRHALIEVFSPFSAVFLGSLLFVMQAQKARTVAFSVFLGVVGVSRFIVPVPADEVAVADQLAIGSGRSLAARRQADNFFLFSNWRDREPRVAINDVQFGDLVRYLNSALRPGETFYEFVNHPFLYVAAGREMPAYFIPVLYNTSDLIQKDEVRRLQVRWEGRRLPIVVFRSGTWWDTVDDVPNEVRSYLIAEFIYGHYQPLGKVGEYQLWSDRREAGLPKEPPGLAQPPLQLSSRRVLTNDLKVLGATETTISMATGTRDPYLYEFLELPVGGLPLEGGGEGWTMAFDCRTSASGDLQVFIRTDGMSEYTEAYSTHVAVSATGATPVALQVPLRMPAGARKIVDVRVDPPAGAACTLGDVRLFQLPHTGLPRADLRQNFDLKLLPYIWGQYDDRHAARATRELQRLLPGGSQVIQPEHPITLAVSPGGDKSTGNYLDLRLRAGEPAKVTITYGDNAGDAGSSLSFTVVRSAEARVYLVRLSTQWAWMDRPVDKIVLTTTAPLTLEQACLRKGD
jgi:hypothetical protein